MMQSPYIMPNYAQQIQQLQSQLQPIQQTHTAPERVNGLQSAQAYQLQPNDSVILWDTTQDVFYIKQSDASGFCTVKAFEYKEKVEEKETPSEYVTKGEFDELKALVDKLSSKRVEQPRKADNGGTKA